MVPGLLELRMLRLESKASIVLTISLADLEIIMLNASEISGFHVREKLFVAMLLTGR